MACTGQKKILEERIYAGILRIEEAAATAFAAGHPMPRPALCCPPATG